MENKSINMENGTRSEMFTELLTANLQGMQEVALEYEDKRERSRILASLNGEMQENLKQIEILKKKGYEGPALDYFAAQYTAYWMRHRQIVKTAEANQVVKTAEANQVVEESS